MMMVVQAYVRYFFHCLTGTNKSNGFKFSKFPSLKHKKKVKLPPENDCSHFGVVVLFTHLNDMKKLWWVTGILLVSCMDSKETKLQRERPAEDTGEKFSC